MRNKYTKTYFKQRDVLVFHMAETVKDLMKKNKLKKVLDVGCGSGLLVKYLQNEGFKTQGCDISPEAIKMAQIVNPKSIIKKASATNLPYKNNSFDLVVSISVIEHLHQNEVEIFLKEARRVLIRNGRLFLVTPNFSSPLRIIQGKNWFGYSDPTHINYFTKHSLTETLKRNGFLENQFQFNLKYHDSINWEFPPPFAKFPKLLKLIIIYVLFSTPISYARNSLWVFSKKIN